MTTTESKPKSSLILRKKDQPLTTRRGSGIIPGAATLPQVNLLPDSIRAKRQLQRTRIWLVVGVALVLLVSLVVYVLTLFAARTAESELQSVEVETQRLLSEQATYSEVPQVLGQIADAELAQRIAMGNEILWADYTVYVLAALPDDAKLTNMTSLTSTPLLGAPIPADMLHSAGVGTLALAHRSPTVPDLAEWRDKLADIPGFLDAQYQTATISEEDGVVYYEVTTTVQLSLEALSGRYLIDEEPQS